MNILRIIYDFADKNVQADGLSTGPYELTLSQGRQGEKIYVLTGNLNGKNLKQGKFKYTLCDGNVVVYNLPRAIWKFGPFLSTSIVVLPMYFYIRFTKKIDLVHNHQQMGVWFLLYKWIFGFIDKIPVVHTNHATLKPRMQKAIEKGEKLPIMTKYFEYPLHMFSDWLSARVANALVAVSENTKEEILSIYKPKSPVFVLENGVNTDKFTREGKKAELGFAKGSIVIGNGGRLSKRKNIDFLVESLKYLPKNYVLVLWGPWDEEFKTTVVDPIIEKENLSERVKSIGTKPYWNVDEYFRAVDIFSLPSSHEGLPKVVVEALSAGCKCVASGFDLNITGIPNMYFIDDLTPKGIAEKTLEATKSPDGYQKTYELVEKHYSWNSRAIELKKIYEKVVK